MRGQGGHRTGQAIVGGARSIHVVAALAAPGDLGVGAMPAAHVGHASARLQLGLHTLQRGNPFRSQVRRIARAEKPLGAVEQ